MFGFSIKRRNAVGVIIGFIGAALLIVFGKSSLDDGGNNWYGLWIVLGCFCYGMSANTVKAYLQNMNALTLSAAAFAILLPFAYLVFGLPMSPLRCRLTRKPGFHLAIWLPFPLRVLSLRLSSFSGWYN